MPEEQGGRPRSGDGCQSERSIAWSKAIKEAAALAERFEIGWWLPKLHRIRGMFLTTSALTSNFSKTSRHLTVLHPERTRLRGL